jgi:cytochrome c553
MSVLIVSFVVAALTADGASVYRENCAACHGKEGHGDGPTAPELKYKPRDFREGKFAFGNTPGAMVKTVMSGIPGELQARMPAFKSVLAAEEIDAVVAYVRTMMPVEPAPTPTDMKLEPRDGALIVRGILPSLEKDGPPIARGLLVGLPSGFSFEYATKPVRLLAVRRGEFVSRTDWEERGGRPLTPLGSVVFATAQPPEWAPFVVTEGSEAGKKRTPLVASLRSTSTKAEGAELAYDLFDPDGKLRGHVKERPRDVVVSDGSGIVQEFEVSAPAPTRITVSLAIARDPGIPAGDPDDWRSAATRGWTLVHGSATSTTAVIFRKPEQATEAVWALPEFTVVDATLEAGPVPMTLKRIVIARGATTREQLEKMTSEVKELR